MRHTGVAALALFSLALVAGSAGAFSYTGWQYGDAIPTMDGRSMAMGGAGMASSDGARGVGVNPALVGKTEGIEFVGTVLGMAAEESRDIPLHDSFDGIIADNTFALNTGFYDHYMASVAYRPSGDFAWAPAVAIGYRPRLDMNYKYHVQYRDPDTQTEPMDKVLYDYYADGDGGVNAFSVALGQEVVEDVYVGLGIDFLRGDYDLSERTIYPVDSDEEDVSARSEFNDVSGTQFTLGLLVETLHRVDIAVVYRSAFDLSVSDYSIRAAGSDSATIGSFDYRYPDAFGIGFEYHPRNLTMTTVSFDVEYTRWSDFEWAGFQWSEEDEMWEGFAATGDPDFDDTIVYRVGVEHGFYDDTQARFGFVYEPSYTDNTIARTGFCMGVGLDVLGMRLDIGGQLNLREYDVDDARLRETTTQAMATLVHTF
ncbi:MAG: outer membrane protein transport protein [Candidatus Eisenbacteria bacterium]